MLFKSAFSMCNFSWMNLREILNSILRQNLVNVVIEDSWRLYRLTERGRGVLEYFNKAQILLP
ncbi:MAG: hypothetical protein QXS79_01530 [Candidatus Bathyarchaeia archaeon]